MGFAPSPDRTIPEIAQLLKIHVANMMKRVDAGDDQDFLSEAIHCKLSFGTRTKFIPA